MELYVYESNALKGVIDLYESLIWTKRFREGGEFELYLPMNLEVFKILKPYSRIKRLDDDTIMVVEKIKITTDEEKGDYLLVTGRSLEGMLQKEVIGDFFSFRKNDTLFTYVDGLLMNNRGYGISTHKELYDQNSWILSKKVNIEFPNETNNAYDIINQLCINFDIGYKVIEYTTIGVYTSLYFYEGVNRGVNQLINNPVIFSPEYDNLISSEYEYDTTNEANVAIVDGGLVKTAEYVRNHIQMEVKIPSPDININLVGGIHVDGSNIVDHEKIMTNIEIETIKQNLSSMGRMQLGRHKAKEIFEAEIDVTRTFKYKKDFFVGDIVTIQNEYGISKDVRIIEMTEVDDTNGYRLIPVLEEVKV